MKRMLVSLLIILTLFSLTACAEKNSTTEATHVTHIKELNDTPFVPIENEMYLSYDKYTRIIYYLFRERASGSSTGYGYMSPYYSRNGNLCHYIDGNIIEILD